MVLVQILLAILSLAAIWLAMDDDERKQKWAPIFGLASQPFWIYTSFVTGAWGIFALSFAYTFVWMKGIYTHWIKEKNGDEE